MDVDLDRSHSGHVERDSLAFSDQLHQRLPQNVPNGQLVKDVRVSLGQVSDHKRIIGHVLNDLACNQPWLCELIGADRFIAKVRDDRGDDVPQDLVGALAGIRAVVADRRNDEAGLWRFVHLIRGVEARYRPRIGARLVPASLFAGRPLTTKPPDKQRFRE